jgi:hypothetical protein
MVGHEENIPDECLALVDFERRYFTRMCRTGLLTQKQVRGVAKGVFSLTLE